MTRISKTILALISVSCANVFGQSQDTSRIPNTNSALTAFDQSLNTLDWYGMAGVLSNTEIGSLALLENFHSVLIKGSQNLVRDEQNFDGGFRRVIVDSLYGTGDVASNFVSDNRQIGLNSVGSSSLMGGLLYLTSADTLLGEIGNEWDQQAGVNDIGLKYSLHGATPFVPAEGSQLFPSFTIQDEQIFPRRNYDRDISLNYRQNFLPNSSLNFGGSYSSQLRAFYFAADSTVQDLYGVVNNIEDRLDNQTFFSGSVNVPILFFQLFTHSGIGQRQIDFTNRYKPIIDPEGNLYDTRIKVLSFDVEGQLSTTFAQDSLSINMTHTERNETHSVINLDTINSFTQDQMTQQFELNNIGARNTLNMELHLNLGRTSVHLTGLASLFRYDTPSELNYDDRDELTNTLALEVNRQFTPFLQAGLGMEADFIHMVYIESQRSANNNRNFIYRLFPTIVLSNSVLNSFNKFEVLANYTVYDYEAFSQVHSYSFRQADFFDSSTVRISNRTSAFLLGDLKLYSRGELYWSNFSEFPLNYFVDRTLWITFFYDGDNYRCGVGYKYLALTQYNYTNATTRQFASQWTNSGPTTSFIVNMSHLRLVMTGWYQVSWQSLQNQIVYPNFELNARYTI